MGAAAAELRLEVVPKMGRLGEGPESVVALVVAVAAAGADEAIEPNVPKPPPLPIPKDGCPNDVPPGAKSDDEEPAPVPVPVPFPPPMANAVVARNKLVLLLPGTLVEALAATPPPPPSLLIPNPGVTGPPLLSTVGGREKMDGPDGPLGFSSCSLSLARVLSLSLSLSLSPCTVVTLLVAASPSPPLSLTERRSRPGNVEDEDDDHVEGGAAVIAVVALDRDVSNAGRDSPGDRGTVPMVAADLLSVDADETDPPVKGAPALSVSVSGSVSPATLVAPGMSDDNGTTPPPILPDLVRGEDNNSSLVVVVVVTKLGTPSPSLVLGLGEETSVGSF